jgi:hypothetical protein
VGVCCPKPEDGFAAGAAPNGDCVFVFGVDGLGGAAVSGADWPKVKVGFGLLGSVCWLKNARHSQPNAGRNGERYTWRWSDDEAQRRGCQSEARKGRQPVVVFAILLVTKESHGHSDLHWVYIVNLRNLYLFFMQQQVHSHKGMKKSNLLERDTYS